MTSNASSSNWFLLLFGWCWPAQWVYLWFLNVQQLCGWNHSDSRKKSSLHENVPDMDTTKSGFIHLLTGLIPSRSSLRLKDRFMFLTRPHVHSEGRDGVKTPSLCSENAFVKFSWGFTSLILQVKPVAPQFNGNPLQYLVKEKYLQCVLPVWKAKVIIMQKSVPFKSYMIFIITTNLWMKCIHSMWIKSFTNWWMFLKL